VHSEPADSGRCILKKDTWDYGMPRPVIAVKSAHFAMGHPLTGSQASRTIPDDTRDITHVVSECFVISLTVSLKDKQVPGQQVQVQDHRRVPVHMMQLHPAYLRLPQVHIPGCSRGGNFPEYSGQLYHMTQVPDCIALM